MIIGVNLPNYSSLGYRNSIIAIAQTAEALGYASLWTNDHVLLPANLPEPFGHVLESLTTLSYLAASTDHIRLGTGILVLPQRDPLLVAKQAATISHLSGGLKRAATLGDGWYGLWRSPDQVRAAVAQVNEFGRKEQFEVSVRVVTRIGSAIPDSDPETTLQGDADAMQSRTQPETATTCESRCSLLSTFSIETNNSAS